MVGKVCVIGGGPSGLSVLCWFAKLKREGKVGIFFSTCSLKKIHNSVTASPHLNPKCFDFVIFGLGWGESTSTQSSNSILCQSMIIRIALGEILEALKHHIQGVESGS